MLVLSRKVGQSVRIGSDIRVTVVAVAGQRLRLTIEAPDDVPIYREEVVERIRRANQEAARAAREAGAAPPGMSAAPVAAARGES
jgi:carbon storage regulator